ncbi:MAG: hypothetical protein ABIE43_04190 [Patescibacteria group bacterium]
MLKIFKKIINIKIALLGIIILSTAVFLLPSLVLAADIDVGLEFGEQTGLGKADPRIIVLKIIRVALGFLGIIAVALIMYAGWLWMTSEGDEEKINQAKRVIKNVIIGLIIIMSSFAIVSFILNKLILGTTGGPGSGNDGPGSNWGTGALGACSIESVYPEPYQEEVPRNTSIIITFKEAIDPATICKDKLVDGGNENGICETGEFIISDNIKIFHDNESDECLTEPPGLCASQVKEVNIATNDNKTFVFKPVKYLGSSGQNTQYAIYLSNDILKLADSEPVFENCTNDYFEWNFWVSNLLDFIPPQVKEEGVFPAPDNKQDSVTSETAAKQASGSITVKNQPDEYTASKKTDVPLEKVVGDTEANLTGTYICDEDFTGVEVSVDPDVLGVSIDFPFVGGEIIGEEVYLGCGITLVIGDGVEGGDLWKFNVTAEKIADILIVGNKTYTFGIDIASDPANSVTASNIATALGAHTEIDVDPVYVPGSDTVNIKAKVAGTAGDNIVLTSTSLWDEIENPTGALEMSGEKFTGGIDSKKQKSINSRADKPRNAVIHVEFNEAINPLTVSGKSDDVKNYIKVVNILKVNGESCNQNTECASSNCTGNVCAGVPNLLNDGDPCTSDRECKSFKCDGTCKGDNLKGKFEVSNQYKTVEFISDIKCGTNSCGEPIYCLPENSGLNVELTAAMLGESCAADGDCIEDPYLKCPDSVCAKEAGKKHPLSSDSLNGIMDVAFNSLDGDRSSDNSDKVNGDAEGPKSQSGTEPYNENNLFGVCASGEYQGRVCTNADKVNTCGEGMDCTEATPLLDLKNNQGDSYKWSFFISEEIDSSSPIIIATSQLDESGIEKPLGHGKTGVNLYNPILINFNKLMMSSSLRTGSTDILNGQDPVNHKLINLRNFTKEPLGYWIASENKEFSGGAGGYPGPTPPTPTPDGEMDWTKASIKHSEFSDSTSFRAQLGSGIKDIYQNCFKPSSSDICAGGPSCCGDISTASSECP